jgi:hypothetical protein
MAVLKYRHRPGDLAHRWDLDLVRKDGELGTQSGLRFGQKGSDRS